MNNIVLVILVGSIIGFLVGMLSVIYTRIEAVGETSYSPISEVTYDKNEETMTVSYSDKSIKHYNGSSTVWYEMPFMKRCSTTKELELSGYFNYLKKYGNPYPNAHLEAQK